MAAISILLLFIVTFHSLQNNGVMAGKRLENFTVKNIKLGVRVGWNIIRIPAKYVAEFAFDITAFPINVASKLGVDGVIKGLKIVSTKSTKEKLDRWRKEVGFKEWSFELDGSKYTLAKGPFGVRLFREKIKKLKKSKNRKIDTTTVNGQSKKSKLKKIQIPNKLKRFFRRFSKRN